MQTASVALRFKKQIDKMMAADELSTKAQRILISAILFFCLIVRISTINAPALDRTAWKEIDYIVISQNYINNGFNFFKPEISWPAEPPRVTAIEFPLVPYVTAFLTFLFGLNVYSIRFVTLVSFLVMTYYLFRLAKRELGPVIGLLSAFVVSILPLYHPFGAF
ncbi:MAG TPA: glycosyltransferase family 39 protein, partial [Candidatus Omnitrophota bacterium]|nr:glycosyltransferase family 39 protein [Candidatus Omnitrophota bacterium]